MRSPVIAFAFLGLTLQAMLAFLVPPAEAQQTGKIPRVGVLLLAPLSARSQQWEAFRQGLRDHGYVEGRSILIEFRSAEGRAERLAELAAELVQMKVDVIVASGTEPTQLVINLKTAKALGLTIPPSLLLRADQVIEDEPADIFSGVTLGTVA
jgi:ABC-type uncharacterized transport system substrate-binding protein